MQMSLQSKVARFLVIVPKFIGSERSSRTPPWIERVDGVACGYYHASAVSVLVSITPERRRKACCCARCALAVVEYAVRVLHSVLMVMSVRSSDVQDDGLFTKPCTEGVSAVFWATVQVEVEDAIVAVAE